jgi:hypothetical protein
MAGTPQIRGLKEAAKTLRQIDPEMRKVFNASVREIAKPVVDAAKSNYNDYMIPSGTRRKWQQGGKPKFPFTVARARSGVRVKIDTRTRSRSAIKIVQVNPAAAIYEFAGNGNRLGRAFSSKGRQPARVMWPAADANLALVQDNLVEYLKEVEDTINRELSA